MKVTIDLHGFTRTDDLVRPLPRRLLQAIGVPLRGRGGAEEEPVIFRTVAFTLANAVLGRYICGGCPMCEPSQFRPPKSKRRT